VEAGLRESHPPDGWDSPGRRGTGYEPGVGDAVGLAEGGGMAGDRGQEGLPVHLVDGGGGVHYHGGRARDGPQQRDLPHSLSAAAPAQEVPVLPDVELAGGDRAVGVPGSPWGISALPTDTSTGVRAPARPWSAGAGRSPNNWSERSSARSRDWLFGRLTRLWARPPALPGAGESRGAGNNRAMSAATASSFPNVAGRLGDDQ